MPPDNGQYLAAAYVVAGTIYLSYAISLMLRARKVTKAVRGDG
jgi:hypothetical protein